MAKVHSFETLGALDGPGLRTVVFFGGCNYRCLYCHNPDMFTESESKEMSCEEIVSFVKRYKNFYGTKGGVTLSGGEPLMQKDELKKLIPLLKKENIHTALDTAGGVLAYDILDLVDLVILDFKASDSDTYKKITGQSMNNFLKTLDYIKSNKIKYWARQVIVSGYTDTKAGVKEFAKLSSDAQKQELLPYHAMGKHKYEKLNIDYPLKNLLPPSKEKMEELVKLLK